jgi:hypothetical protein
MDLYEYASRKGLQVWEIPILEGAQTMRERQSGQHTLDRFAANIDDLLSRVANLERHYQQAMAKQSATNKHLVEEIERLNNRLSEWAEVQAKHFELHRVLENESSEPSEPGTTA